MNNKKRIYIMLGISTFLFVIGLLMIISCVRSGYRMAQVNDSSKTSSLFSAFTIESNIYMALISFIGIILSIKAIISKKFTLPLSYELLYLSGVSSLTLVFIVVASFLAVIKAGNGEGYFYLFGEWNFFNHFLNPLIAFVCFDFVIRFNKIEFKKLWLTVIPLLIYSIMYIINVLIGRWPDFYYLTFGGKYQLIPLVFTIILAFTFGVSFLHSKLHNIGKK